MRHLPRAWPIGGGASGAPRWLPLVGTPAALIDTGSLTTTGTGFDGLGRLTIVYAAAHAAQVDGFQEAVARYTIPLLTLIPDFDPDLDVLDLGIDCASFVHGSTEAGLFLGILDSTTIDASLAGACASIWQSTAATDRVGRMVAASNSVFDSPGLVDAVQATFSPGLSSTNYELAVRIEYLLEGETTYRHMMGGEGTTMRSPTSNWVVAFGAQHVSTDVPGSLTQVADLWYRRRRVGRDFP